MRYYPGKQRILPTSHGVWIDLCVSGPVVVLRVSRGFFEAWSVDTSAERLESDIEEKLIRCVQEVYRMVVSRAALGEAGSNFVHS